MRNRAKPTVDEIERLANLRAVGQRLVEAMENEVRARGRRPRWVRSELTDAIVNAGPGWQPGRPFTDLARHRRRIRDARGSA